MFRQIYHLLFTKDKAFLKEVANLTGYWPRNPSFYHTAFIHRSQTDDETKYPLNNERLEFLGDSVLDMYVAEYLFMKYPTQDEGFLTQMRSKIVNRKRLNEMGARMGLDIFLRKHGVQRLSGSILGNALEAFIGAVYLDLGQVRARRFVFELLRKYLDIHELELVNNNYKSQLLEYCQKNQKRLHYRLLSHQRNNENRERFRVAVEIDDMQVAIGEDYNKKGAEQLASRNALLSLGVLGLEESSSLEG